MQRNVCMYESCQRCLSKMHRACKRSWYCKVFRLSSTRTLCHGYKQFHKTVKYVISFSVNTQNHLFCVFSHQEDCSKWFGSRSLFGSVLFFVFLDLNVLLCSHQMTQTISSQKNCLSVHPVRAAIFCFLGHRKVITNYTWALTWLLAYLEYVSCILTKSNSTCQCYTTPLRPLSRNCCSSIKHKIKFFLFCFSFHF